MAYSANSSFIAVVSGMEFEARLAQGDGIRCIWGLDSAALYADMEQAVAEGAAGFLSFGTAAGLSPALLPGTIVIAQNVRWRDQMAAADHAWSVQLKKTIPEAVMAEVAGVDAPLASAAEKAALHAASNAPIADMESHQVARIAREHNLPFAVLRVILDDAGRALPPAALAATRRDGSITLMGLLGSLMRNPGQVLQLLRLGGDHAKAKSALLYCRNRLKTNRFGLVN